MLIITIDVPECPDCTSTYLCHKHFEQHVIEYNRYRDEIELQCLGQNNDERGIE